MQEVGHSRCLSLGVCHQVRTSSLQNVRKLVTLCKEELTHCYMPNLLDATRQYWRNLDQLEAAYQRGEISLAEVDQRVAVLMADLGQERRAALRFLWDNLLRTWSEQRDLWLGTAMVLVLCYVWISV